MKTNSLNLYFLGSPQIELDDQPIEIHLHKALALLAFLAVKGKNHRRDTLATFFWPDCSQGQSRSYLRNALWVLRESLGESWLIVHREEVGLQPKASVWVDVAIFQQHLREVELHRVLHPSDGLCQICIEHLNEAINLYRDDFLSGFTLRDSPAFDEWQEYHCEDLRHGFIHALERVARWHAGQGDSPTSISFARRLILLDPFNEKARQLLMKAFYKSGHRQDALQQYQDYAQILRRELNLSPSIEITELYKSMKADSITLTDGNHLETAKGAVITGPLPPDVFPRTSSGAYVGIPAVFIPPITFPTPLPFVKRQHELEKLVNLLRASVSGHGKIIFISGGPGSGKTTLALEFIRRAQEKYPGLIVSGGTCLPLVGPDNPYFVFQEVFNLLAGEVEQRWAEGILTIENLNRLFTFLPTVLQTLVDSSPDLISAFLPTLSLSSKIWAYKNQGLSAASLLIKLFLQDYQAEKTRVLDLKLIFKQCLKTLQVLSAQRPLLVFLDDLHWADLPSIHLLTYLGKHIDNCPILIVGAFCPQEVKGEWLVKGHAFTELLSASESINNDLLIDLDQVGQLEGQEFTEAYLALEPNHLSQRFKKELYRITTGQPLFLSEYLQEMKESGALYRDEENFWADPETFYSREVRPDCLEAVIEARIRRLPEEIRKALDAASVAGIEFTIEILAGALKMDRVELIQLFIWESSHHRIVVPLSLYQSGPRHLSWYRFRHSLYQKYLYNQLCNTERTHFHQGVGASMEQIYGDHVEEVANQLAWHFQEAGNADKAAYYLQKAVERASRLGANEYPLHP